MAGPNVERTFRIKEDQLDWLQGMAAKFSLPDEHKALRTLIDYAMKHGDLDKIFMKIHCLRCNTDTAFEGLGYKRVLKHKAR
jgi:hypothetical protein